MRQNVSTRTITLQTEAQREQAMLMVRNMPLGVEIVAREPVKARKPEQNSLMWAGALSDMADAWIDGKQYRAETWHEYFKANFLPETADPLLVKKPETYQKWDYTLSGQRVLVGSTTDLTVRGFAEYLEQIYAFGSMHGVRFKADGRAA